MNVTVTGIQSPNSNLNLSYIFQGGAPVDYVRPSYFIALNAGYLRYTSFSDDSFIDVRL